MTRPTDDAIRARARELWERDGKKDGRDIEYWLEAALELEEIEAGRRRTAEAKDARRERPIFAPALTLPLLGRVPRLR